MADQVQRLVLEVKNAEEVARLTSQLDQQRAAIRGYAKDLHDGVINLQQYEQSAKPLATTAVTLKDRIKSLEGQTRDYSRAALEASHALQDFAQGGVGGVLNNTIGVVEKLGGTAGLAASLNAVAVAAYIAYPFVTALWKSLTDGGEAIPTAVDTLDRLNESLKTSRGRLEEMKSGWGGSAGEVAAYNAQVAETKRIEAELEKERKQRSESETARNQKTDDQSALSRDFGKVSGGTGFDRIVNEVAASSPQGQYNALRKQYDQLASQQNLTVDEGRRMREMALQLNEMARAGGIVGNGGEEAARRQAEALVNRARGGDLGAFDQVVAGTRGDTRDMLTAVDPRLAGQRQFAQQQAAAEISDAIGDVMNPIITSLRQANEKAKADAKLVDDLNKAGAEGENLFNQQLADNAKIDQRRAADTREQQQGMTDARKAVELQRDSREGGQIRRIAAREFDANLNDDETAAALKRARELVEAKWRPDFAARQAISEVVAELIGSVQRATEATFMQGTQVEYMRMQLNQVRQMQQRAYTLMTRGGAGG